MTTHKVCSVQEHATDIMQCVTKFQDGNILKCSTAKFKEWWLFHQFLSNLEFTIFQVAILGV